MALPRSRRSVLVGYHPPRSRMSRKKEWVSDLTDSERDREGLPPVSALSAQRSMEEAFEPAIAAGGSGKSWSQGAYSREGSDIEWQIAKFLAMMYGGAKAGQYLLRGMSALRALTGASRVAHLKPTQEASAAVASGVSRLAGPAARRAHPLLAGQTRAQQRQGFASWQEAAAALPPRGVARSMAHSRAAAAPSTPLRDLSIQEILGNSLMVGTMASPLVYGALYGRQSPTQREAAAAAARLTSDRAAGRGRTRRQR